MEDGENSPKRAKAWHLSAGSTRSVVVTSAQALANLELPGGVDEEFGDGGATWMTDVRVGLGAKRKRQGPLPAGLELEEEEEEDLGAADPMMESATNDVGVMKSGSLDPVTPAWCCRLVDIEDLCSHIPRPLHMVDHQTRLACSSSSSASSSTAPTTIAAASSAPSTSTPSSTSTAPAPTTTTAAYVDPTTGAYDPCKTELMEKACPKIALVVRPEDQTTASTRTAASAAPSTHPGPNGLPSEAGSSDAASISRGWVAVPKIPLYGPYNVRDLDATKTHLWCTCGAAKTQPWCDGSGCGSDSPFAPLAWKPARVQTMWSICGCKHTQNPPFCDASHTSLVDMVSAAERRRAEAEQPPPGPGSCSNCSCK